MTQRIPVLALVFLMALFTSSIATAETSLFGGVNFPTVDFNSGAKTGWNAGGYYTVEFTSIVDIGATLGYTDFNSESSDYSINAWEIQALAQIKILFLKGYLGMGVANYRSGDDGRNTKLSWQMGVSAQISIIEGRLGYHQIPVDGGSVNWMSLTAGLIF